MVIPNADAAHIASQSATVLGMLNLTALAVVDAAQSNAGPVESSDQYSFPQIRCD